MLARTVAEAMLQTLGQQIIVDNRGASINIGAQAVPTAKPDGNTFMSADNAMLAYNEHLFTKLPFNPEKDFTDVGGISRFPLAGGEPRVRSQDGEGVSGLRTRQPPASSTTHRPTMARHATWRWRCSSTAQRPSSRTSSTGAPRPRCSRAACAVRFPVVWALSCSRPFANICKWRHVTDAYRHLHTVG